MPNYFNRILSVANRHAAQGGILQRAAHQAMQATDAIADIVRRNMEEPRQINAAGIHPAVTLQSYDAMHPKRPSTSLILAASTGGAAGNRSFPWGVFRFEGPNSPHKGIPHPADWDPDGSGRERYMHYLSIFLHYPVGTCLPFSMIPSYPVPGKGQMVRTQLANPNDPTTGIYIFQPGPGDTAPTCISTGGASLAGGLTSDLFGGGRITSRLQVDAPSDVEPNQIPGVPV